jgi:RNA polymerase sigma factor for flagellar operon FliA
MDVRSEPGKTRDLEEAALWTAFVANRSAANREQLFLRHAAFARNIARRHHREQSRGDIDLADLYQLAYAGLLEALERFDPRQGVPFRPFAAHRISGSVSDGIVGMSEAREQIAWRRRARRERLQSLSDADTDRLSTSEAMEKLAEIAVGLAIGFMLEGTGLFAQGDGEEQGLQAQPATAYDSLAWKEIVVQLHDELSSMPEREQMLLRQHYLIGVNFDQLAQLMELTKGRVSQIHRAALGLLRKRLSARGHFRLGK